MGGWRGTTSGWLECAPRPGWVRSARHIAGHGIAGFLLGLVACTPEPRSVVRVPVQEPEDVARLLAAADDVWSEHVGRTVDVVLSRRARADLARRGVPYEVLIEDLDEAVVAHRSELVGGGPFFDDWQDLDAYDAQLDALEARGAVGIEVGTSVEGRAIRGLVIAAEGAPPDRPEVLVTGLVHAREWVAGASAMLVADRLVVGRGVLDNVDALLDRWTVVVVPVVNPDGFRHTWTTDRLWRKNRRLHASGAVGVDLNRNFGEAWGLASGSSGDPASNNYRGPGAFSEPESAAIRDLVRARPALALHLDLHCTGQLVLHPHGFTSDLPEDVELLAAAAEAAELAMEGVSGVPYDAGPFHGRLYPASGLGIDWTHAEGLESYLFELRDRGRYGFLLPAEQLRPTAEEAWAGFVALTSP